MTDGTAADRRGGWVGAIVAFAAALVLYLGVSRVTSFEFLNYDDVNLVAPENPSIGKGLVGGLPELLDPTQRPQFMNAWLPLYYWSIGVDHAVAGYSSSFAHLHSALLHALGAAMVALIARRLGASAFVAGLAGAIFAVHPAATESVAWVASRKDLLSFVWMAAAALCYLQGIAKGRFGWHVVGAAFLAVSLLAKGSTLVLPFLLVAHAVLFRRDEPVARKLAPVAPYAAVAVLLTAIHLWVASWEGTAGERAQQASGIGAVLVTNFQVVWRYAVELLLPAPWTKNVAHDIRTDEIAWAQVVLGAAVLAAAAVAVRATWRRSPAAALVLVAVPLALLPFNNVLPRTAVLFAERYAYVALFPVAIGAAWLLRPRGDGPASMLPAAIGVGALAAFCAMRMPVWHDSIALWEDASAKSPRSAFVQLKLADAYTVRSQVGASGTRAADWVRAENAWRSANQLVTGDTLLLTRVRARQGLGAHLFITHAGTGDAAGLREAVTHLEAADVLAAGLEGRGVAASRAEALSNRGACKELLGDNAGALADYETAVRFDEKCAPAWNGLARRHLAAGRGDEVRTALAKSAAAAPHDLAIVRERVKIRLVAGDNGGAKQDLADAIAARPLDADLRVDAARLDSMLLRPVDAETNLRKALEIRPGDSAIRDLLASALLDQAQSHAARDDMAAAREAAREAGEVVPGSSAPEQILGIVARRGGDLEAAAQHLRKARDLHPEGVRIREQLASVLVELAARLLDEGREALALILLEEAVQTRADAVATPRSRLDTGVADWPLPSPGDDRAEVARNAALKGLAYLGVGRAADAQPELVVAEAGTRGAEVHLRRVVLRLVVRASFAAGRADEALALARELSILDVPDDASWPWKRHVEWAMALIERGTARRSAGDAKGAGVDFDAGRAALETARGAGAPASKIHTRLGEIRFREEDFLAATKEFDRAVEADAADVEPVLDRAAVWRTLFLLEEDKAYLVQAERDFRRAAEFAPSDPRVLAGLGETLLLSQKPGEAFPWLQRALLADPSQTVARRLLADLIVRAGRSHLEKCAGARPATVQQELAEARSTAERALALDPPAPEALVFLGDVLRAQGEWPAALAKFELAREKFPDSTAPLDAIARYHMDRGHFELLYKRRAEALASFRKALEVPGTTIDLTAARERLHEAAVTAFGEAMELDREGKYEEAAERFALSVAAEPTAEGHFARAVVLGRLERFEESVASYDAAIALNPDLKGARLNRAAALLRLGRLDDAAADYRTWLAAAAPDDPDRVRVANRIEWIEREKRDIEKEQPR